MSVLKPFEETIFLRDLGNGLVLRKATPDDTEELVAFNTFIHRHQETGAPDLRVGAWTRDLMTGTHPTFKPEDFTLVIDTRTAKIVSSLNLISQTWIYEGIPFDVGQPELVGTHPDYRGRGLVRAQFEVIHRWSAERGQKVQAITGIPFYYRLFGYEMALDLGGGRAGFIPNIPQLNPDESEPYQLRPACLSDIPFIDRLYRLSWRRQPVNTVWNEALWQYEISGKNPLNVNRSELRLIQTPQGEPVGFLAHPAYRWESMLAVTYYEVKPGLSWAAVTPSVMRYLQEAGEIIPPEHGEEPFGSFGFWLGQEHPVYQVLLDRLPRVRKPYAWYLRLPDLPDFLRLIAPALECRLAQSPMVGHNGELKLSFYREGVRLVFERGRLVGVESWTPLPEAHSGSAAFPGLTFLQLLFGYHSLDELKGAFADCITDSPESHALLAFLFPKKPSNLWLIS
jgi:hypothetical protein